MKIRILVAFLLIFSGVLWMLGGFYLVGALNHVLALRVLWAAWGCRPRPSRRPTQISYDALFKAGVRLQPKGKP